MGKGAKAILLIVVVGAIWLLVTQFVVPLLGVLAFLSGEPSGGADGGISLLTVGAFGLVALGLLLIARGED